MYLREKISLHRSEIERVEELEMADAEVAVLAYGSVSRSAKAAMRWARRQGVKVGVVRPIALWPFPTAAVERDRLARQVRTVIVPEMNLGQLAWEVQAAVRGKAEVLEIGRVDGKLITPGSDSGADQGSVSLPPLGGFMTALVDRRICAQPAGLSRSIRIRHTDLLFKVAVAGEEDR